MSGWAICSTRCFVVSSTYILLELYTGLVAYVCKILRWFDRILLNVEMVLKKCTCVFAGLKAVQHSSEERLHAQDLGFRTSTHRRHHFYDDALRCHQILPRTRGHSFNKFCLLDWWLFPKTIYFSLSFLVRSPVEIHHVRKGILFRLNVLVDKLQFVKKYEQLRQIANQTGRLCN